MARIDYAKARERDNARHSERAIAEAQRNWLAHCLWVAGRQKDLRPRKRHTLFVPTKMPTVAKVRRGWVAIVDHARYKPPAPGQRLRCYHAESQRVGEMHISRVSILSDTQARVVLKKLTPWHLRQTPAHR